ncbi:hypothetical protein ACJX0J_036814, partial [Zea mays]
GAKHTTIACGIVGSVCVSCAQQLFLNCLLCLISSDNLMMIRVKFLRMVQMKMDICEDGSPGELILHFLVDCARLIWFAQCADLDGLLNEYIFILHWLKTAISFTRSLIIQCSSTDLALISKKYNNTQILQI